MNQNDDPLRFVDPMRRDAVRERIRVIEAFHGGPGGGREAYASAESLGLSIASFYRIARVWRETGDASRLGLALAAKQRDPAVRHRTGADQRQAIRDAVAEFPADAVRERIVARAEAIGAERGLSMPVRGVLRRLVDELAPRPDALAPDPVGPLVVDHVALDLGVRFDGHDAPIRPVGSFLIDTRLGEVVDLVIRPSPPSPGGVASLLASALAEGRVLAVADAAESSVRPLVVDRIGRHDWTALVTTAARLGCDIVGESRRTSPRDPWLHRAHGSWFAGVRLRPRLTDVNAGGRTWRPASALDAPLDGDEASTMLRDRMIGDQARDDPAIIIHGAPANVLRAMRKLVA